MSLSLGYMRYDRQIRLWGKTTQQRLMETAVRLFDLHGVDAEVAKNLVLAGVQSVHVHNTAHRIKMSDLCNNLLVQNGKSSMSCEEAGVEALRSLNPYVRVVESSIDREDIEKASPAKHHITLALAHNVSHMSSVVEQSASCSDVIVLSVECAFCILTLFLYRDERTAMEQQWRQLIEDPNCIQAKPAIYQKAILALHIRKHSLSYAEMLIQAVATVEQLHLHQLRAEDIEEVANLQGCNPSSAACTLGGASVAQHVIRHIGEEHAQATRWMICKDGPEVEVGFE